MTITHRLAACILALACAAMPATAHETWAERVVLIHYGEPGGPFDAYKPEQITGLSAIAADGSALAVTARPIGGAAVAVESPAGDPAAVFYAMDLGHYAIADGTWTKATAEAAAAAPESWSGSFTATSILAWHPELSRPRGRSIELVPLADPLSLPAGQELRLRAYRDGKPLPGLKVSREGAEPLVSDAAGELSLPVGAGHQVIVGGIEQVDGGRKIGHLAALSFARR